MGEALSGARRARDLFAAADMSLAAAASATCAGSLLGGDEGRAEVASAARAMAVEGVIRPERFTRMVAPGWPVAALPNATDDA